MHSLDEGEHVMDEFSEIIIIFSRFCYVSACFTSLGDYGRAIEDARSAIALDGGHSKVCSEFSLCFN